MVAVPSIGRASEVTPRRAAPEADATRDLYERYARQIYSYCLHQLGNREEAEDATQSTFLNAFRGFRRGVDPEFESAWLYKIAQNVCLTRQRSSSRRRKVETPGDLDAMQDYVPAHQADSDELIRLPEALDAMPEQQRRALLLREWQGLSYKEIGEELDLSQAAVETLLFRARRTLAAGLGEEPVKKAGIAKRLGGAGDFGSILSIVKSLVVTGGVKVATAVATVAATSVVAATPATRQAVEDVVAPRHDPAPVHHVSTKATKATEAKTAVAPLHAPSPLVPARPAAASALRTAPLTDVASTIKRLRLALQNSTGVAGHRAGHGMTTPEPSAATSPPVPTLDVQAPVATPVAPTPAPPVVPQPAAMQSAVTQPAAPVAEKPKVDSRIKGDAPTQAAAPKKDHGSAGQGTSNRGNGNSGKAEDKHDGGATPATAVTPATAETPARQPAAAVTPAAPPFNTDGNSGGGKGAAKTSDRGRGNKSDDNKSSNGKGDNKKNANIVVAPTPATTTTTTMTTTAAPAVAPPPATTTTPAAPTPPAPPAATVTAAQPSAPQPAQSTKNNQGHRGDGKVEGTDKGGNGKRK